MFVLQELDFTESAIIILLLKLVVGNYVGDVRALFVTWIISHVI